MLGLSQQIGGDNARIGAVVGDGKDLARPGQGINPHLAKDLALGLVDKGVTRPDDFIHHRHALGSPGHSSDCLRAANFKDPVCACEMADRNHRRVRPGRQTGDNLFTSGDRGRHNRHYRRGEDRVAAPWHITSHRLDGNNAVSEMDAWQGFNLQRLHGGELGLSKAAHLLDSKFAVPAGLGVHLAERRFDLVGGDFKLRRNHLIKLL